ncbi:MAG: hypothetical protein HYW49_08795 [Deltaproteobacteria bacterium]|nr:hypothetical protein [Deltaproteobacteria bacterium]
MIEASIDIGTITMLLLVAETEEAGGDPLRKRRITRTLEYAIEYPRLGEGVHENRRFSEAAMTRAMAVFKKYRARCDDLGATRIRALATSASRDSANSREFYESVRAETGIEVSIIGGDTEARLSFLGGLLPSQDPAAHALMDIGGGSTEFVCFDPKSGDIAGQSLDIGSIRASEIYLKGDPYTVQSIGALENGLDEHWARIRPELAAQLRVKNWVAVAGTPTVLAAMAMGISSFTSEKIDGFRLSRRIANELHISLATKTNEERKKIPLVGVQRADVIVAGTGILVTAMEFFGKNDVIVSTRGLRHGVLEAL